MDKLFNKVTEKVDPSSGKFKAMGLNLVLDSKIQSLNWFQSRKHWKHKEVDLHL